MARLMSTRTLPDVPVSLYTLPFINSKLSPLPDLGAVLSFFSLICLFLFNLGAKPGTSHVLPFYFLCFHSQNPLALLNS